MMDDATYRLLIDHLVSHLTDGFWHDECRYCLARRRWGGNGVNDEEQQSDRPAR